MFVVLANDYKNVGCISSNVKGQRFDLLNMTEHPTVQEILTSKKIPMHGTYKYFLLLCVCNKYSKNCSAFRGPFTCQFTVTTVCFHTIHTNNLIGNLSYIFFGILENYFEDDSEIWWR